MTQPPRIEAGTTRLFSVQYSGAPNAVPCFEVLTDSAEVSVFSTSTISASTAYQYQTTFTMPAASSVGVYAFQWTATFSPTLADVTRGLFQVIHRAPWTT